MDESPSSLDIHKRTDTRIQYFNYAILPTLKQMNYIGLVQFGSKTKMNVNP